jgi:tetratricopeptide (TPR) repeat protein
MENCSVVADFFVASGVLAQEEKWKELNQQAIKLYQEGKYAEATEIAQKAINVAEKTFGPNHANVATSLNNLATLHYALRKYLDAEPLYKRSLEVTEKKLGPEHRSVATTLDNLAELYKNIGKQEEAAKLEERSKKIKCQSGSR